MRKIVQKAKEVSPEKEKELKENAFGILCNARRQLLNNEPFIGSIAMNLDIVPVRDIRLPTAATDGSKIYFDIDFLSSLNSNDTVFVLAHEVWHCAMAHFIRDEGREHDLFNVATDLEVNQILETDGMSVPADCLMPDKLKLKRGLSAEEYYELLLKQSKKNSKGNSQGKKSQADKGSGSGSDAENDKNDGSPMNSSGNKDGKLTGQFDKHITDLDTNDTDANGAGEGQGGGNGKCMSDKYGKLGFDKDFNPRPSKQQVDKMREMAVAAVQQVERERGELPAHLKRFVNELLTPKVDWREVLHSFVTRAMGEKSDWNRPNRRFISSHTYLPSHYGDKLKVCVGIDTSGSTGGDIPRFLGELDGLVKSFGSYELTLIECDAVVGKFEKYDDENPLDLESTKFDISGGGGTTLTPIFEKIKEENVKCDCICIFTDGYCEDFKREQDPGVPVLWMISNGCVKDIAPGHFEFGEVCEFEKSKEC